MIVMEDVVVTVWCSHCLYQRHTDSAVIKNQYTIDMAAYNDIPCSNCGSAEWRATIKWSEHNEKQT
jgi:Zn finger protein HypA/HybF involved in hydrogenase expression